ncbi:MAG: Ig-like domain-containing protein [Vicinamibacteria bacterium]|nr:Ig-like domain-containing protein [Vicinamibacteria bacterium]
MKRKLVVSAVAVVSVVGLAFAVAPRGSRGKPGVRGARDKSIQGKEEQTGLAFRLSEGAEEQPPYARPPVVKGEPLSAAETEALLARLPALKTDEKDRAEFALRESSLPAPRTGATVQSPFPPPDSAEAPDKTPAGPLDVLRRLPEGDVPLAPHLSVTFSQPMVAVTSHAELAREEVPVRLTPQPEGEWRWVGSKTLVFQPSPRLAMATDYTVEIPAGTRSATGGALAKAVRWTFSTPPPTLDAKYPWNQPARHQPVLFASFDQRIDPKAVAATIQLIANGKKFGARLATDEEIQGDADVQRLTSGAEQGRWLAFKPERPLPPDSNVRVIIGPGTSSDEGPRRTAKAQEWGFRTYGPLKVVNHRCGWRKKDCRPLVPWQIEFSNPLDARGFQKSMISVTPDLPDFVAEVFGNTLNVRGRSKGRTTYTVTLDATITDVFEQTLGRDETVSFVVGPAEPALIGPGRDFIVLDPAAPPRFSVFTINQPWVRARAYAVTPEDWGKCREFMQAFHRNIESAKPPGRLVIDERVRVRGADDELTETPIDLTSAFEQGSGNVLLVVAPAVQPKEEWRRLRIAAWIQATTIGLDVFADQDDLIVWATSLQDGRPLEGVEIDLLPSGSGSRTKSDGMLAVPIPDKTVEAVVARRGEERAFLPQHASLWGGGGWRRQSMIDTLRWYVFDDRKMYRPGEEVRIKGWLRIIGMSPKGDVEALTGIAGKVAYQLHDSRGNEVLKGDADVTGFGAFTLSFKLPQTMNLGHARVVLNAAVPVAGGLRHTHTFEVQEFRRPEYEVKANASEGPHMIGGHAIATVSADYYAGGALPNAEVTWRVEARPGSYTPPNRSDFTFGAWTPWWESHEESGDVRVENFSARTDSSGKHHLRIDFDGVRPPRPSHVKAEATVMDVNRQAWTANAAMLVHPSGLCIGLRSERLFVERGQPLRIEAIVTDLDGVAAPGREIALTAERLRGVWSLEGWKEEIADTQEQTLTSGKDPVRCEFSAKEGGVYRVTATVRDDEGRPNESRLRLWVAGERQTPRRDVEREKVTLVPDKKEYKSGETAEVLVIAPFSPAEALMTLARSGILRTERFTIKEGTHTLKIRVEESFTPNVWLQVDLVGAAPRTDDAGEIDSRLAKRPAFAGGSIRIDVPPYERKLALDVQPRDKALDPGGETTIDVSVRDAAGNPMAGGEAVIVVVDESVLALTGYRLPDPIDVFYARRSQDVHARYLREHVRLAQPDLTAATTVNGMLSESESESSDFAMSFGRPGMAAAAPAPAVMSRQMLKGKIDKIEEKRMNGPKAAPESIRMRTDMRALALFAASVVTNANGKASVPLKLPDSLTRYRIMVVATDGVKRFGQGEATITARLPLMTRPSPPRFLNFGDTAEVPIVLQNQTNERMDARVAMRAANATLTGAKGYRVIVPANDRVEVRFPVTTVSAGKARFQVAASVGRFADAASFELPVWTPATTEAFATYGQIDKGAIVQPVKAPSGVARQFGGLEITTSSTALQALTDTVIYLTSYPFECTEQMASRILGIAVLRDVLTAFKAEGLPSPEALIDSVKRDVTLLSQLQNDDGGFAFWRRGDCSWPYISIHVANAFARAKEKGFDVPQKAMDRSRDHLREIERHIPSWYSTEARRMLIAYALNVRQRMGDRDVDRARRLFHEAGIDGLTFEALGFVLPVLSGDSRSTAEVAAIRKHLANRVTETAGAAHFVVAYGDSAYLLLHSDRRADAILLEALIADQPQNDLIPKIVEGLLAHRKAGRWLNTQENVFVLLALDRYFNTYEKVTPDFVARMWLGKQYAGEHAFHGRTTDRKHVAIPMSLLAENPGTQDLILAKDGPGRLYYRIGMRYAPESLSLDPMDRGFVVERRYQAVDDKTDVTRDEDGTWRVKAGARVRVQLTMVSPARRYHVALVDPLPAGLEALNPELKTTGTIPQGENETVAVMGAPGLGGPGLRGSWWWWRRTWWEHQNMRDERAEAFASLLWEGVWNYSYVARATTPGRFVVPPPKAEEMYHPETFGRGGTDRVVVE